MHDIRAVRADPAAFDAAMGRRGLPPVADGLLALDAERRAAQEVPVSCISAQALRAVVAAAVLGAASTGVDVPFVMGMQMARFLVVLFFGPAIARFVAVRVGR